MRGVILEKGKIHIFEKNIFIYPKCSKKNYKSKSGGIQLFFVTCLCLERSERNGKKYGRCFK